MMNFLYGMVKKFQAYLDKKLVLRMKKSLGKCGKGVLLFRPYHIVGANNIELGDFVRIMPNPTILASDCKLIIKKYTGISYNLTCVTSNHRPTVGIPSFFNNMLHINEVVKGDVIIGEDCWLGLNVILLPGANIGRGVIVGAGTLVNKKIPPYAVIAGIPAKIIGVKFTKEQVIEHERKIYDVEERMTEDELNLLFSTYYEGKKVVGSNCISEQDQRRYDDCLESMNAKISII